MSRNRESKERIGSPASPPTPVPQGAEVPVRESDPDHAVEEYKVACEFMRQYTLLRFLYLTLLTGTTGSLVTALSSPHIQAVYLPASVIKMGGLAMVLAFLAMELRAERYWQHVRDRAGEIGARLGFAPFPDSPRFGPASTGGAAIAVYVVMAIGWLLSLLLGSSA